MNLANLISIGRLLSCPVVVWLILTENFMIAFWVFLIASLSDAIDGYLARLLKTQTKFGAQLDPVADKILLMTTYILLGVLGHFPIWLVVLVTIRDFLILLAGLLIVKWQLPVPFTPLFLSSLLSCCLLKAMIP